MQFISTLRKSAALVTSMIFVASLFLNGCGNSGGGGSGSVDLATLTSISISPTAATVVSGQTKSFTATGAFANGTTADITGQVSWASADTGVATIKSSTGIASGVAVGSTNVIASVNGITSNNAILTVKQLSTIAINPAAASVAKGLTTKFTAIGTFTDGTTANITSLVTWAIGDSTVATINSATGFATGVTVGTASVTATASGITSPGATLSVIANTATLSGISISSTTLSTPAGTSVTFTATGTFSDGTLPADVSGLVVWSSTNSAVATINGTGIVTTLAQGGTTISASANNISSNNATLTVTAAALTKITVNPAVASVPKWLSTNFTATGTYTDGTTANITSQVTWAIGNSAVATINSTTGAVTGVTLGSTTVRASSGSINSADASLTVTAAVLTGISITPATKSTPKGSSVTFTATGTYSDGSSSDASGSVIWTSTNTAVATINGSGVLTSRAKGTTTVTASASGLASNSATLTVTDAALTSIAINPTSASVAKGLTTHFTAIGTYTDATTANITNQVIWATDDPAVSSINSTTGSANGSAVGSTTVTASANGITSPGASLYVTAAALTGISISPTTKSTPKGTPVTFTATGTYSDGNSGDVSGSVTWTSSNTTVATMNSTGIASSLAQGSVTVSASASGQTSNNATLTVTAPVLAALSITPPIASVTLGNTRQFSASGVLTDGTIAALGTVAWTSSDTAVATIDGAGLVTTHASGSTNISAISDGVTSNTSGLMVSLAASGGISAVSASGQLTISWTAVTGATSYNLYYGTASGLTAAYTKITGVASPYLLTPLVDGNTYYYRIGAVAADGSETLSAEAFAYLYAGGSPAGNFTSATNQLSYARVGHNSTLLASGKVLVTGGEGVGATLANSELFDPATFSFTATGSLQTARAYATDTLLPNGKVLVIGGHNNRGSSYLASAELFNPALGTFTATGNMTDARDTHTATLLANGKVLVAGGWNGTAVLATAEIYDPATGNFTSTGSMQNARHDHTATLLASGKVLLTGGCNIGNCSAGGNLNTAEIYDPATGTFTATTGNMLSSRFNHTATLIAGGKVFIIGGKSVDNSYLIADSQIYDPATGIFTKTATMMDGPSVKSTGFYRSALLLSSGDVLVMPCGCGTNPTGAHLYNTATNAFTLTGTSNGLHNQNSVLLFNGQVLLTGGELIDSNNIVTISNDAELFK